MQQYSPTGFKVLPTIVKNILILNGLMFLATIAMKNSLGIDLADYLGLKYFGASEFKPYQIVTYMFMHGNLSHLFFNMFALWMFGSVIENYWGAKRFLIFYFITGIGAAIVHYSVFYFQLAPSISLMDTFLTAPSLENLNTLISKHQFIIQSDNSQFMALYHDFEQNYNLMRSGQMSAHSMQVSVQFIDMYREAYLNMPSVVGASGAVYGLLLAFGMLFPNSLIYIYFLFPIKAKWMVIGYGALEIYSGVTGSSDGIAHFAHLGGMLFGLFLILYWKRKDKNKMYHQF